MTTSITQFNNLNSKTVSRAKLETLLRLAQKEKATEVVKRLQKVLRENDDLSFEITIKEPLKNVGLSVPIKRKYAYTIASNCIDEDDCQNGINGINKEINYRKNEGIKIPSLYYNRLRKLEAKKEKFIKKNTGLSATAEHSDTVNWNMQILEAKRKGFEAKKIYNLGKTKGIVKKYFGNYNINVSGQTLIKSMSKDDDHIVSFENLINLPDYINNPLAIFKSDTVQKAFVILVEIYTHKEKPLIVAIHFQKEFKITKVASIYNKRENNIFKRWYNKGLCIYDSKKKPLNKLLSGLIPVSHAVQRKVKSGKPLSQGKDNKNNTEKTNANENNEVQGLSLPPHGTHIPINSVAAKMIMGYERIREYYEISDPQIAKFLGKIEKKTKESVAITIAGEQGSQKTRLVFQLIKAFGSYKIGHASIEEHPDSELYEKKLREYVPQKVWSNLTAPEIENIADVHELVKNNDIIIIDSFTKLQEMQRNIGLDKDFRKAYDGKLFIIIYQMTTGKTMRGGSKSQYDGDIIIFLQKENDYTKNYAYFNKNRYNHGNLEELKYSVYHQKLVKPTKEVKLKFKVK